ncbi:hypothetical protein ES703_57475 [subsurface metagenome]
MKVEFLDEPHKDLLLISAETAGEAERLHHWHNCVLSAEYNPDLLDDASHEALLICREI